MLLSMGLPSRLFGEMVDFGESALFFFVSFYFYVSAVKCLFPCDCAHFDSVFFFPIFFIFILCLFYFANAYYIYIYILRETYL